MGVMERDRKRTLYVEIAGQTVSLARTRGSIHLQPQAPLLPATACYLDMQDLGTEG